MQVLSWPALSTITAVLEHHLIDLDICDNVKQCLAESILYCPRVEGDAFGLRTDFSFVKETLTVDQHLLLSSFCKWLGADHRFMDSCIFTDISWKCVKT